MECPLVSVVMPVFNGERTLSVAVDSVLSQTYSNFELIICNDASTDGTQDLLTNISDSRVQVFHNLANLGEGLARDKAIAHANGQWLAFIDADDAWHSKRLEILMKIANELGESFIFDDIMECHDTSTGMHPWRTVRGEMAFGGNGENIVNVPIEQLIRSCRSLVKPIFPMHYIKEHMISHSTRRYGEDMEFFLLVLAYSKLAVWYVPKPLYLYRITPGSASGNKARFKLLREVLADGINLFPGSPHIHDAFQEKIRMLNHEEKYITFVWALKDKKFIEALRMVLKHPRILIEFSSRVGQTLAYHAHRIWHHGRLRGTL